MSDEAKQKVATAAKQVKHAVSNIEDATELQVEEVVEQIVQSAPIQKALSPKMVSAGKGLLVGGVSIGAYILTGKLVDKTRVKLDERKKAKEAKARVLDNAAMQEEMRA